MARSKSTKKKGKAEPNNPTVDTKTVVKEFQFIIENMQSDPDYLADLSPSQLLGQVTYLNNIGSQIKGSFSMATSSMVNILNSLVPPYTNLPEADFTKWLQGQTSFADYNNGKPVPSYTLAVSSMIKLGTELPRDLSGITITDNQYNQAIAADIGTIINTANKSGYGTNENNAWEIAGILEALSNDPFMQNFSGLSGSEPLLVSDAQGWASTWGIPNQGVLSYNAFVADFKSFLISIQDQPFAKNLAPFNPPAPPAS
jgi:hypothetical protein